MTLIVALRWGQGILVSADTRVSAGPYAFYEEQKLFPILFSSEGKQSDLAIVAGAGDAALVKQGSNLMKNEFREWYEKRYQEAANPSVEEVEKMVKNIQAKLISNYYELRKFGVEASADLLLATVTREGEPLLYTFNREGLAEPRHENPGYALLGTGEITGGLLLMRLLGYSPKLADVGDAGLLSMFIIDMVSEVDPNVSPFLLPESSAYIRYDSEHEKVTIGALTLEAYGEYKRRIPEAKNLLKKLWSIIEQGREEEVSNILDKLLSSEESHRS